jgi:hypothetical protein
LGRVVNAEGGVDGSKEEHVYGLEEMIKKIV